METELNKLQSFGRMSGDRLYEYILVITPDAAVLDKVMQEKQLFSDAYKEKVAVKQNRI